VCCQGAPTLSTHATVSSSAEAAAAVKIQARARGIAARRNFQRMKSEQAQVSTQDEPIFMLRRDVRG
jgi:hypothetical protein